MSPVVIPSATCTATGASGARIVFTLSSALRACDHKRGAAAISIGGGVGRAVCVELI